MSWFFIFCFAIAYDYLTSKKQQEENETKIRIEREKTEQEEERQNIICRDNELKWQEQRRLEKIEAKRIRKMFSLNH